MAYSIKLKNEGVRRVEWALEMAMRDCRFNYRLSINWQGKLPAIEIREIRLNEKKDYCGNHAGPCRLTGRRHREYRYLEGADWVSFNDMVNDILDRLRVEADVASAICVVRKGRMRCIEYFDGGFGGEWARTGRYKDNMGGRPMRSEFPDGTPGITGYKRKRCRGELARRV